MAYQVKLTQFQGPFDVLLQLIEQQELSITEIALAKITDDFIQQLTQVEECYPEELADFLVIAARLLYIKSRALLPYLTPGDDEPASQLAVHLRMYKEFRDASDQLANKIAEHFFSIARETSTEHLTTVEFSPPPSATPSILAQTYQAVIDRVETVIQIPQAALRKAATLKDKITALHTALTKRDKWKFSELTSNDRMDVVMTFLAILELIKQEAVVVQQPGNYSDIIISKV